MAAMQVPSNSVWSSMNYLPPRGPCNYKNGIMSGTCPCLRFMLHPVKAATSFECDGCSHHASYHSLENKTEDAILQKWSDTEKALASASQAATGPQKNKRRRIAQQSQNDDPRITDLTTDQGPTATYRPAIPSFSVEGILRTVANSAR